MKPLHAACARGDLETVKRFLSQPGENVNARDRDGFPPLFYATGHLPLFQYLVQDAGADVELLGHSNRTIVHVAAHNGQLPVIQWLFESYCGGKQAPNDSFCGFFGRIDHFRETALHYAAQRGNLTMVKYLVEVVRINILEKNWRNSTVLDVARQESILVYLQSLQDLYVACTNGNHIEVLRLLQAGVYAQFAVNRTGDQLIHVVAESGDVQMAQLLQQYGDVDIDARDIRGITPLYNAIKKGNDEMVHWLCKQGALVDAKTDFYLQSTPLAVAVSRGQSETARILLDFGADIHYRIPAHSNFSALHEACSDGNLPLVQILFQRGGATLFMHRDNEGCLPLHWACRHGHIHTVQFLISHGHFVLESSDWIRALKMANAGGHADIMKLLLVPRIVELTK